MKSMQNPIMFFDCKVKRIIVFMIIDTSLITPFFVFVNMMLAGTVSTANT